MSQLRRLLNSPIVTLAALTGATVATVLAIWLAGSARSTFLTLAVLACAFWATLATHKLWRIGRRVQTIEAEVARHSVPAWARPLRSEITGIRSDSEKSLAAVGRSLESIESLRHIATMRHSELVNLANASSTPSSPEDVFSVIPAYHHETLSAHTATDLLRGLRRTQPETISILGSAATYRIISALLTEIPLESKIEGLNSHPGGLELGLLDVLVIDTTDQDLNIAPNSLLGTLSPRAEIWIIGLRSRRDSVITTLRNHDSNLSHVVRHDASGALTILGKAPA